ncbi:MAG: beta-lactamase family protein [Bacteroidales bacterium]|nr:beta-lactamase family protein [Bacteroidales bacterium]
MTRFMFKTGLNPGLGTNCTAIDIEGIWHITVPENADLTKLAPEITVSEGASVLIDGMPYTQGNTYDFSCNLQNVLVTSESGNRSAEYHICVKKGDTWADERVYNLMKDFKVPGVALSIMRGTDVMYSTGLGFADKENFKRCSADHLFRIAGVSRIFCTMCIMTLCDQGRLSPDDTVFGNDGILKGIIKDVTPYHESIRVKHLLSCSSGLCAGLDDPCLTDSFRYYGGTHSPVPVDTLIQRALNVRQQPYDSIMVWSAGAGYYDSNFDYCVLQRIVEIVSGKEYESFLKEDVLSMTGIQDTHIGGYSDELRENESRYYTNDESNADAVPLREMAGALGVISSANQLMRILCFMDSDDTVPDIFSFESIQDMYSPFRYSGAGPYGEPFKRYGLGWALNHPNFEGAHYSYGSMPGSTAFIVGRTSQNISGVILCNASAVNENSNGTIKDNLELLMQKLLDYYKN